MTEADDTTDRAAELVACPKCGEVDLVQKISAIPDWPAEFGPPDRPGSFDSLGVVSLVGGLLLALALREWGLVRFGNGRLKSKAQQRSEWEEGMRFWKRLYFCARDEVAFIRGGTSTCPLHEIRNLLCSPGRRRGFARKPGSLADFSPMPEEFADFERMLEEAKEKSGTLICYDCGHDNPIGQTNCEGCGASVPQTARARWAYGKDK